MVAAAASVVEATLKGNVMVLVEKWGMHARSWSFLMLWDIRQCCLRQGRRQ